MHRCPHRYGFVLSVFILASLLPSIVWAQADPTADTVWVDLFTSVRRALEVSPEVDVERAQLDYAEARRGLARASRFATEFTLETAHAVAPGLKNLPAGIPRDELYLHPDVRNDWEDIRPFNRFETSLIQPIYTWGQLGGSIAAARHGVDVEEAAVEEKALEVALRTGELYYSLLLTVQLSRLTEEADDVVQEAKREIRRLLDEGAADVDDADLFQVRITEQEFNRRVVEVEQSTRTARSALRRQLFLPDETFVSPQDVVLRPLTFELELLETYQQRALVNRPEIQRAQSGIQAREQLVRVARSDFYPKLFLGIESRITLSEGRFRQPNPYVSDPFRGRSLRAGLGLRLPLNLAQTRARVSQAEAERNEVRHQLTAARQLVLFEVEEAYRNLITARAAMEAQEEALTISREWLRTEQINFDLDLGDTENLVKAVQASLELEASFYERVRAYNRTVLRLLAATGTLTERIDAGDLSE